MTIRTLPALLGKHLARRSALILAVSVLTAVGVGALSSTRPAEYRATADILLPSVSEDTLIGQVRLVEASSELAEGTAQRVQGISAAEVTSAIDVSRDGTVLTISATGGTPALVRDIADSHAAAYIDLDGPGALVGVKMIRSAQVPSTPVGPRPLKDGMIAGLLALGPATAVVLWWAVRRDRIRSGADVRSAARVLAELPLDETVGIGGPRLSAAETPDTDYVAAIETILRSVAPTGPASARRVLIVGADERSDASQVAANLAWVAASRGWRTVLVSGDSRQRRVNDLLAPYMIDIPAEQRRDGALDGLIALPGAGGREHLAVAVAGDHVMGHLVPTKTPNLCVLPCLPGSGDRDPGAMLSSDVVGAVLEHLDGIADLVIIDSPAASAADDAYALADRTDDVIVVAAAHSTSRQQLRTCVSRFDRDRRRVRGVVVDRVRCRKHRPAAKTEYSGDDHSRTAAEKSVELVVAAPRAADGDGNRWA